MARGELGTSTGGQSIKDLGNWVQSVWAQTVGTLAGAEVSLDDIEHKMLRTEFADPRIHACLNCASVSCPSLPRTAFEPITLDQHMEACCDAWIADETKGFTMSKHAVKPGAVLPGGKSSDSQGPDDDAQSTDCTELQLKVSKIFHWYDSDFAVSTAVGAQRLGAQEAAAAAEKGAADTGVRPTLRFVANYSSELRRELRSAGVLSSTSMPEPSSSSWSELRAGGGGNIQQPSYFNYDWGLIIDATCVSTTSKPGVVVEFESPW